MNFKNWKLDTIINLIIIFVISINLAGILLILDNLSYDSVYQQITSVIVLITIWALFIILIKRLSVKKLLKPLKRVSSIAHQVSIGDLSEKTNILDKNEIGQIASSFDIIIQNQINLAEFAEKIGDGTFDVEYEVLSEKDKLGLSITGMRDKLLKLSVEDDARKWVSEGLTQFSEMVRDDDINLSLLGDKFLSSLVKYLSANQGMIFLYKQEKNMEAYLELLSAYAWSRKKYLEKKIEPGQGLIGQVAIEKDKIYVTETPEDYITITSGLGDANPRSILVVPMISNDEMLGVIELASFKQLRLYEIEFVEKLAEILASAILRIKTNEQTQALLRDSQKLTEELRTQEEEMRQNLEEMNATQEEMQQREVERIGIFTAINNTLATVEFNMEGRIIHANDKFLKLLHYTIDEIENETDRLFVDVSKEPIEEYNNFWEELKQGNSQSGDFKRVTKEGREIWINASYTPALDKDGVPYKVIALATDITEKKMAELETKRQAEELRIQGDKMKAYTSELEDIKTNLSEKLSEASQGLKKKIHDIETEKAKNVAILEGCVDGLISFNQDGYIEYFNKAAEEIWGVGREKVLGKPIKDIIPIRLGEKNELITAYFTYNGTDKEIGERTEVSWVTEAGKEFDLLATLTSAKVDSGITFTIFAQQISVDLF